MRTDIGKLRGRLAALCCTYWTSQNPWDSNPSHPADHFTGWPGSDASFNGFFNLEPFTFCLTRCRVCNLYVINETPDSDVLSQNPPT